MQRSTKDRMKTNGGFLISQIKQIQGRVFGELLVKEGITEFNGAQGRILYVLWQEDNLPIIELSHRTGLAKNTLTSMLDRMEERNIIKRCADERDKRVTRIVLCEKARQLNTKYDEVSNRMNDIFYKNFSEEEVAEFEHKLELIIKNLNTVQ